LTTLIVGCGYLGQRVARLLTSQGERVVGTVRSNEHGTALESQGIEPIIADVLDPDSLSALPDSERVVYCVGFDASAGSSMRAVYVDGLRNVVERLAGRPRHLVYASSTGVYGQDDGRWVTEDDPPEPRHEAGRVCLDAETLALGLGTERGLATVVLRFAGLYGPGRVLRRASLERGDPIQGDPGKVLNLVHIDDAAQAVAAALARGAPGSVYLVCDDRPVERREYYQLAAALLGAPSPRFELPEPGSRKAGRDDSNKRISNRRLRSELGVTLAYPDITTGLPASLADHG
jgi:nucleoside-diphosphate-sugar epimerase